jgi:hypothetical protein
MFKLNILSDSKIYEEGENEKNNLQTVYFYSREFHTENLVTLNKFNKKRIGENLVQFEGCLC